MTPREIDLMMTCLAHEAGMLDQDGEDIFRFEMTKVAVDWWAYMQSIDHPDCSGHTVGFREAFTMHMPEARRLTAEQWAKCAYRAHVFWQVHRHEVGLAKRKAISAASRVPPLRDWRPR